MHGPLPFVTARARLERHQQYPHAARLRREQGTVVIRFTVARGGEVVSWRIVGTSGSEALDREAEAMLQRAAPLPPLPASVAAAQLVIQMPVIFALR